MLQLPAHISKRYHAVMDNITPVSCKCYLLTPPYILTASNVAGMAASAPATLAVYASNMFAYGAGAYNGLFYQTNANGTAKASEATSGFLGNCVVAANGAFSAKLYNAGQSYSWSGNLDTTGLYAATISTNSGILNVRIQLSSINGNPQLAGYMTNMVKTNAWCSPLFAVQATNSITNLNGVNLALSTAGATNAPAKAGAATGMMVNGALVLYGVLGDGTSFSQSVPVGQGGYVPVYTSLYNGGGLLEGWLNLSGGQVAGSLAWISPSGASFPLGFNTVAGVTGATF
jgi:hypothetical protein